MNVVLFICIYGWVSISVIVISNVVLINVSISGSMGKDCMCVVVRLCMNSDGNRM